MKYALLLTAAFLFTACNSTPKHDHAAHGHDHDTHAQGEHNHPAHVDGDHEAHGHDHANHGKSHSHAKAGDTCACEGSKAKKGAAHDCASCKDKTAERKCCSDKTCTAKDAATCSAANVDKTKGALAAIEPAELTKLYTANKSKLGKQCSAAASAYCGKVSRDMNINETELNCLWGKVFRTTRETMPKLDNSDCAKTIKSFAKNPPHDHAH